MKTEREMREYAIGAAAYWLDASEHEQTPEDAKVLARYARLAIDRIVELEAALKPWVSDGGGDYDAEHGAPQGDDPLARQRTGIREAKYLALPGLRGWIRVREGGRIEGETGWSRVATDEEEAMFKALTAERSEAPEAKPEGSNPLPPLSSPAGADDRMRERFLAAVWTEFDYRHGCMTGDCSHSNGAECDTELARVAKVMVTEYLHGEDAAHPTPSEDLEAGPTLDKEPDPAEAMMYWHERAMKAEAKAESFEAIQNIWLHWRENGMANAITRAGEYLHKIGKVVEPDYPTDRLREDAFGRTSDPREAIQQAKDLASGLRSRVDTEPHLEPAFVSHWLGNICGHLDRALATRAVQGVEAQAPGGGQAGFMGPGFGDAIYRDMLAVLLIVILLSVAAGVGLAYLVPYVRDHLKIEWRAPGGPTT